MKEKCLWCFRKSTDLKEIELDFRGIRRQVKACDQVCESELRRFIEFVQTGTKWYVLGLAVSILGGLFVTFWRLRIDHGALGMLILLGGSGMTLVAFPFVTPQTVEKLGVRTALQTGRLLGVANVLIGVFFWWFLSNAIS